MNADFYIGHSWAKQLRPLAECEQEHGAITRLEEWRGTEADVLLCAAMYERVGEAGNARQLMTLLERRGCTSPHLLQRLQGGATA
jgi:hypothetical protein